MVLLAVHVTPRTSKDEVCGWKGTELAVRVTAPPDAGRANLAVCEVVARALGVPKTSVRVSRGGTSRHKVLEIGDVELARIESVFGAPDDALF